MYQLKELTQRECRGPNCKGIESDSIRWNALVQVEQRVHCKHHHTAWKDWITDHNRSKTTETNYEHHIGNREATKLTNWFRNSHDLRAVKWQVAQRPDDRMDLLHYVERDCNNATCVLTHSHTPARAFQNIQKLTKRRKWQKRPLNLIKWTDPGHVWLGSNRMSNVGS